MISATEHWSLRCPSLQWSPRTKLPRWLRYCGCPQRVIDLADGDLAKGNLIVGSPLASAIAARGHARWCLGMPGWREDFQQAIGSVSWTRRRRRCPEQFGTRTCSPSPTACSSGRRTVLRDSAEALAVAEQSGDDLALDLAQTARGVILVP